MNLCKPSSVDTSHALAVMALILTGRREQPVVLASENR